MPTFEIENSTVNRAIVKFICESNKDTSVKRLGSQLRIETVSAIKLDRLQLGSVIREMSDGDWVRLYRQISKSLEGGRLWPPRRNFDRDETWLIRINPLKTKGVYVRLDEIDYSLLKEAAALAKKSISDFVRSGALKLADETFDKETHRRARERQQQELTAVAEKSGTYVI